MKPILTLVAVVLAFQSFAQGQFQNEASGSLSHVSGQVMKLAEAIPADKFSYTPQTGVRSVAQVFAHIISANYFFGSKLGAKIPDGVNMQTLEKDLNSKDKILPELKRSYDVMIGAIKNTKDNTLGSKVEFPFPGEFTTMTAILIALGHSNEHLGQLIAYARMNGIKPPWSE